jgi:ribosomal-protein-alanine N-acetyltransferase
MADPFPVLHTERLVLRELVEDDADDLLRIHGDAAHMRWFGTDPITTIDDARDLVRKFTALREQANPGARWALTLKGDPRLIGTCSLFGWHRLWRKCATGYEIAPQHAGRGLMREALTSIIDWGFANMEHLHRIEAQVHPENVASLKLLAGLAFVEEGRLREVGYWNGRHQDLLQLAVLRRDWGALQRKG